MATFLSTNSVKQQERFSFWREAVCDSYVQLDCNSSAPDTFQGEIILHRLSQLSASFVAGSKQEVRRRKRDIARSHDASFLISLQLNREAVIEQADRAAHLTPGDFALYSSTDRYALHLPDGFRQLVIQVPRDDLLRRLPNADLLTGTTVRGGSVMGGLVNDSVLRMVSAIDQSNEVVRHCMQDTIVDLFATGLASLDQAKFELSAPEQQVLLRANAFLKSNLANPDLDRTMLAEAVGFSVRRLGEIFQGDGKSIAMTIRAMRLQRIAADLKDQRFGRCSISDIAYRWGVRNLQSFNRMFRTHFGQTPREYRNGLGSKNLN